MTSKAVRLVAGCPPLKVQRQQGTELWAKPGCVSGTSSPPHLTSTCPCRSYQEFLSICFTSWVSSPSELNVRSPPLLALIGRIGVPEVRVQSRIQSDGGGGELTPVGHLLCPSLCAGCFTCSISLNPPKTAGRSGKDSGPQPQGVLFPKHSLIPTLRDRQGKHCHAP